MADETPDEKAKGGAKRPARISEIRPFGRKSFLPVEFPPGEFTPICNRSFDRLSFNFLKRSAIIFSHWQLLWQLIEPYTIIRRFLSRLVGISLDRNDWEVINLSFVLLILFYLNVFKAEKILQFWEKKFSTCMASSARGQQSTLLDVRVWENTSVDAIVAAFLFLADFELWQFSLIVSHFQYVFNWTS